MSSRAAYDFYVCGRCNRLITAPEISRALGVGPKNTYACTCGGRKIMPANLPWYGWLLPRVWTFAIARLRGLA
jgi:DNA-directed RNA polymerase subunit RPC12/RpoP